MSAHTNHYSPVSPSTEDGTSAKGSQACNSGHPPLAQRIVSWQNFRSHLCFESERSCPLLEGFVSVCTLYLHKKAGRNVDPMVGHVGLESCKEQREMYEKKKLPSGWENQRRCHCEPWPEGFSLHLHLSNFPTTSKIVADRPWKEIQFHRIGEQRIALQRAGKQMGENKMYILQQPIFFYDY